MRKQNESINWNEIIVFVFSFIPFVPPYSYRVWSMKMRWSWFCLRPRLHIGHFLRDLMTLLMHGAQNRWPHIVDRISSIVNISKQIGHFVLPIVAFCGDGSFAGAAAAVVVGGGDGDGVAGFGLSHKSIVPSIRCGWRDSVTKITSSSSSTRAIGLIERNCAGSPMIMMQLSSKSTFVALTLTRLVDTGAAAVVSGATGFESSSPATITAVSGSALSPPPPSAFVALFWAGSCVWDSRMNSPNDASIISASRIKSDAMVCVSVAESSGEKKWTKRTWTKIHTFYQRFCCCRWKYKRVYSVAQLTITRIHCWEMLLNYGCCCWSSSRPSVHVQQVRIYLHNHTRKIRTIEVMRCASRELKKILTKIRPTRLRMFFILLRFFCYSSKRKSMQMYAKIFDG